MGLLNLRNALMAGKRLPYDAEVEFLESTGTQWIDTGIEPNTDDVTTGSFGYTAGETPGDSKYIAGVNAPIGQSGSYFLRVNSDNKFLISCAGQSLIALGGVSGSVLGFKVSSGYSEYNGVSSSLSFTPNITISQGLPLFCRRAGDGRIYNITSGIRIGSFCVTRIGVKILDLIPVRVGTIGYMYDRVSKRLFGNAGTGDFVLGPDKN